MLRLRKVVFYVFLAVYLVLCPLIVARMLGFAINPLTHRFVKTGLVVVTTAPSGASVYVDGRLSGDKTPAVVRDLIPGEHFVRIEYNGYKDWEDRVPIVPKEATVISNVALVPDGENRL